jgi:hypothetical protein
MPYREKNVCKVEVFPVSSERKDFRKSLVAFDTSQHVPTLSREAKRTAAYLGYI